MIDLSRYYNAALTEPRPGSPAGSLATLPRGLRKFAGVDFDVRGIVQLGGKSPAANKFPAEVTGIKVGQKCQHLYFLHAACFGGAVDEGKEIAAYVVHFAANQMRLEIPVSYGRDVRNWLSRPNEPEESNDLTVAWKGTNAVSYSPGRPIRLVPDGLDQPGAGRRNREH